MLARDMLEQNGCAGQLKKVFPHNLAVREAFYSVYGIDPWLSSSYNMYAKPALSVSSMSGTCQMYLNYGCSFVLEVNSLSQSKKGWLDYIISNEDKIKKTFLPTIQLMINFIKNFTGIASVS